MMNMQIQVDLKQQFCRKNKLFNTYPPQHAMSWIPWNHSVGGGSFPDEREWIYKIQAILLRIYFTPPHTHTKWNASRRMEPDTSTF